MKFYRHPERLRKRAALDLAKKLRLEPYLARNMRRIFRHIIQDFKVTYARRQQTLVPAKYQADVTGVLREHYRKVYKDFYYSARDELSGLKGLSIKASDKDDQIDENMRAKLSPYILEHSEKQAKIILQTTEKQLQAKIQKVIDDSLAAGEAIDAKKIAALVASDYSTKITGRSELIAVTETQSMSERVKNTEIKELDDYEAEDADDLDDDTTDLSDDVDPDADGDTKEMRQVWVAVLDDHTREAHAEADGQEVGVGESFNVGGEWLEYPGDPAGSDENIMFCRCAAVPINV
jgi:hypothetical protein